MVLKEAMDSVTGKTALTFPVLPSRTLVSPMDMTGFQSSLMIVPCPLLLTMSANAGVLRLR